jgi:hypothetical protein
MAHSVPRPHTSTALLDEVHDVLLPATCPMCHTRAPVTKAAVESGGTWRCIRCGQHWDAVRLAAVAAYAAWVVERDRAPGPGTNGNPHAAQYLDPPTERLDGTP